MRIAGELLVGFVVVLVGIVTAVLLGVGFLAPLILIGGLVWVARAFGAMVRPH
jgi:hypothetical protein